MTRHPATRPRLGFTLVEILVVIAIISLLIALLVPAIGAAVKAAHNAAVQAEINTLAQALADFKSQYGDYPPSRVVLFENGHVTSGNTGMVPSGGDPSAAAVNDITWGQLEQRSLSAMRKFFPRVPFGAPRGTGTAHPDWFDFNGDNVMSGLPIILQGNECLVFFLGGIPLNANPGVSPIAMTGFGKAPTNPFSNSVPGSASFNANRNPPLFEFAPDRLHMTTALQTSGVTYGKSGSGFQILIPSGVPGYVDSTNSQGEKQNFYAYFSTNNGSGYDPNDMNLENSTYDVGGASVSPPTAKIVTASATFISPSPNPYTTGTAFQNPQSFQIISPGGDGAFGFGGVYIPTATTPLPFPGAGYATPADPSVRNLERDNLTNFHNGKLD